MKDAEETEGISLEMEREFDANIESVFAAFANAEFVQQWWCPPGFVVSSCIVDFRVGGKYEIEIRSKKMDGHILIHGLYKEINAPDSLKMTHSFSVNSSNAPPPLLEFAGHDSLIEIQLTAFESKTKLLLKEFQLPSTQAKNMLESGWPAILDQLKDAINLQS